MPPGPPFRLSGQTPGISVDDVVVARFERAIRSRGLTRGAALTEALQAWCDGRLVEGYRARASELGQLRARDQAMLLWLMVRRGDLHRLAYDQMVDWETLKRAVTRVPTTNAASLVEWCAALIRAVLQHQPPLSEPDLADCVTAGLDPRSVPRRPIDAIELHRAGVLVTAEALEAARQARVAAAEARAARAAGLTTAEDAVGALDWARIPAATGARQGVTPSPTPPAREKGGTEKNHPPHP